MSYTITVSGTSYFEALDHLGTEAARDGVPEPTELVRAGKGHKARFCGLTLEQASAVLSRLETAGDPKWIAMLRGEGQDNRAEIRAALACQKDAEKVRALLGL